MLEKETCKETGCPKVLGMSVSVKSPLEARDLDNDVFSPCSHRVLTVFSPCSHGCHGHKLSRTVMGTVL